MKIGKVLFMRVEELRNALKIFYMNILEDGAEAFIMHGGCPISETILKHGLANCGTEILVMNAKEFGGVMGEQHIDLDAIVVIENNRLYTIYNGVRSEMDWDKMKDFPPKKKEGKK